MLRFPPFPQSPLASLLAGITLIAAVAAVPVTPTRVKHGVPFCETLVFEGRHLELRGLAVREVTFLKLDVYAVALYGCNDPSHRHSGPSHAIVLDLFLDIDRGRLAEG